MNFSGHVAALSDPGLVRDRNEDAIAIDGKQVKDGELTVMVLSAGSHNLVLADGLGGHARGDVASSLVARQLSEAKLDSLETCLEAIQSVKGRGYFRKALRRSIRLRPSAVLRIFRKSVKVKTQRPSAWLSSTLSTHSINSSVVSLSLRPRLACIPSR